MAESDSATVPAAERNAARRSLFFAAQQELLTPLAAAYEQSLGDALQGQCQWLTLQQGYGLRWDTASASPAMRAKIDAWIGSADAQINCFDFSDEDVQRLANVRLAIFDMDSTLIETEVIDELASCAGAGQEVKAITAAAMRGELDFKESFRRRVALLRGLDAQVLAEIAARLPLMPGLDALFHGLRQRGIKTAIVSGGFMYFARFLKTRLQADYAFANHLEIIDGRLSGHYLDEIIDGSAKQRLLQQLAAENGLEPQQCLAVGDGANDLAMLQAAGIGVAFHAKPLLKQHIRYQLDYVSLDALLGLLG